MPQKRKYTDEQFITAVTNAYSVREVLETLNLNSTGGNYVLFWKRVKQLQVNTSHFKGNGWAKGKTKSELKAYKSIYEYLGTDKRITSHNLKLKLFHEGLKKQSCEICNLGSSWCSKYLSLQLDHIDGDKLNNSLSNLRILCPNCHSQTDTFAGKNKGKGSY